MTERRRLSCSEPLKIYLARSADRGKIRLSDKTHDLLARQGSSLEGCRIMIEAGDLVAESNQQQNLTISLNRACDENWTG